MSDFDDVTHNRGMKLAGFIDSVLVRGTIGDDDRERVLREGLAVLRGLHLGIPWWNVLDRWRSIRAMRNVEAAIAVVAANGREGA